jgi:FAD dependent oxidoreductase TIGR03364
MNRKKAIVVGAGIVGLATARALALKGFSVEVFDRHLQVTGASIRNFGMIWPIGQPHGKMYDRAIRSCAVWKEICPAAGIWHEQAGSLHLAYESDEMQVLEELYHQFRAEGRAVSLLSRGEIIQQYEAVNPVNLLGGLLSREELIVDPREAMAKLPAYLNAHYPIRFHWGKVVTSMNGTTAYTGEEQHEADIVIICSGADFETLFPAVYSSLPLTKCKLQMMRLVAQPANWRMGPALCGGLSLIHYNSFKSAASLQQLEDRYRREMGVYLDHGIHVMVSQNGSGELTVGDSHEYGLNPSPFDSQQINDLVLAYLKRFAHLKDFTISASWNGVYPKLTNGATDLFLSPAPGVYILNGLGGAGMTLSFGLAEEIVNQL